MAEKRIDILIAARAEVSQAFQQLREEERKTAENRQRLAQLSKAAKGGDYDAATQIIYDQQARAAQREAAMAEEVAKRVEAIEFESEQMRLRASGFHLEAEINQLRRHYQARIDLAKTSLEREALIRQRNVGEQAILSGAMVKPGQTPPTTSIATQAMATDRSADRGADWRDLKQAIRLAGELRVAVAAASLGFDLMNGDIQGAADVLKKLPLGVGEFARATEEALGKWTGITAEIERAKFETEQMEAAQARSAAESQRHNQALKEQANNLAAIRREIELLNTPAALRGLVGIEQQTEAQAQAQLDGIKAREEEERQKKKNAAAERAATIKKAGEHAVKSGTMTGTGTYIHRDSRTGEQFEVKYRRDDAEFRREFGEAEQRRKFADEDNRAENKLAKERKVAEDQIKAIREQGRKQAEAERKRIADEFAGTSRGIQQAREQAQFEERQSRLKKSGATDQAEIEALQEEKRRKLKEIDDKIAADAEKFKGTDYQTVGANQALRDDTARAFDAKIEQAKAEHESRRQERIDKQLAAFFDDVETAAAKNKSIDDELDAFFGDVEKMSAEDEKKKTAMGRYDPRSIQAMQISADYQGVGAAFANDPQAKTISAIKEVNQTLRDIKNNTKPKEGPPPIRTIQVGK